MSWIRGTDEKNLIDRLTSIGASVLSKVTSVSQEDFLLLSRSEKDPDSLFYSCSVYECSCHGDEWSWYRRGSVTFSKSNGVYSLSGLPLSLHIQEEQVYLWQARRPQWLISSSPLSDELAVEAAWLQGKMANFPKAFKLPLATVCLSVCLCLCSALHL